MACHCLNNNQRKTNIELLRIVAMLMVVSHHFAYHGGFEFESMSINSLWIQFIMMGGRIGTDLFVLISGYFLICSEFRVDRVIRFWVKVLTYSVAIYVIFCFLGGMESFRVKTLIHYALPITFNVWWFASTYFVLYLLSPFVNKLLMSLDRKQYVVFLGLMLVIWSIIPTFTKRYFQSNELLWFVFLYSIAGYIRIYGVKSDMSGAKFIVLSCVAILLTFFSGIVFNALDMSYSFFYDVIPSFCPMVISVLLFLGFLKYKMRYSRIINKISSASFGVYLIHDNEFVRNFLWHSLFKNSSYADSWMLIPYSLFAICFVYIVCTFIELVRTRLFERKYLPIIEKLSNYLITRVGKFEAKI